MNLRSSGRGVDQLDPAVARLDRVRVGELPLPGADVEAGSPGLSAIDRERQAERGAAAKRVFVDQQRVASWQRRIGPCAAPSEEILAALRPSLEVSPSQGMPVPGGRQLLNRRPVINVPWTGGCKGE